MPLLTVDLPVERMRLENGLQVVVQPDRRLPLVAIHLCYPAGSRHDPPRLRGLAHLSEHLAFRGARAETDYGRLAESAGGAARASTFHDYVFYSQTLPARSLVLGLWIEAQRMAGLGGVAPGAFETQRKIVLEERRQRVENRPFGASFEILQRLCYPAEHPYHFPSAGLPEGLRAITRRDVEEFLVTRYVPEGAVLVLTGDVSLSQAHGAIERSLGSVPSRSDRGPAALRSSDLGPVEERRRLVRDRVPCARTYLAIRGPGFGRSGWHATVLWVRSLALGRSSPLQRRLVDRRGVASAVHAWMLSQGEASTMVLAATAAPATNPRRLEEELLEAVAESTAAGLSDDDVERARKKVLTDHYAALQELDRRAEMLGSLAFFRGAPQRLAEEGERYAELTAADLERAARALRPVEGGAVLTIVPQEGGR